MNSALMYEIEYRRFIETTDIFYWDLIHSHDKNIRKQQVSVSKIDDLLEEHLYCRQPTMTASVCYMKPLLPTNSSPLSLSKKQKQKKNLKTRKAMCNVLLRATSVRSDSKNDKNPAGHLPFQS